MRVQYGLMLQEGCTASVFIISPLGIKSITLQHDRADEIVFAVY